MVSVKKKNASIVDTKLKILSLVENNVYSCSNHEIITIYCYFYVKYTHADTIAINRNGFYMIRTAVPENGNASFTHLNIAVISMDEVLKNGV